MKMKQNLTISSTFILIFIFITLSASADIPLGSSLSASTPNQTWPSPNKSFSLRFLPLNSSSFSLSITYDSLPIWSISAVADSAATFSFLANGNLRLLSGTGNLLWQSNTSNSGVTHATLDDSGNFSLKNRSNSVVWTTFDHPTDTIVPSQNFNVGMVLSSGLYSFTLNKTGNLTLQWNKDIAYWSLGLNDTVSANLSNPRLQLQSIGILSLYDGNLTGSVIMAYGSDYAESGDILRFLRLDNDGNLRIYSSSKGSGSATVRWTAVSDQCQVFGYCGNMGICSYNDTSPVCGCPSENFVSVDPNDSRKGCKLRREIKDCPGSVAMLQMEHTKFLTYAPETLNDVYFVGISACRGNCLSGSSCVASTTLADGSGQCYIKTSSFVSGYESAALPSTSYVKVCSPAEPNAAPSSEDGGGKEKLQGWIIAVVVLGTLVGLILLEGSLWWWCCRKSPKFGGLSAQYALLEYASGAPVQFSYKDLQQATRNFKEKLGAGGFGAVYKGILANRTVAAVKQLEGIEQGEKQFRMEVATISSTHHLNLVRLIGFCSEGKHRLLVYEFMKNGSLDSFLFATEDESGRLLSWEHRFNIALGTARGITYLHEECRDCIVHCDIKPENILLDDNYNAKVSDFGLAKLVNPKDHRYRTLTSVRGTRGYLAPEWLANLPITSKSDVYSFGMVLLEIVSGRRNFEVSNETDRKKFSIWAYEEFEKGKVGNILDRRLADFAVDMDQVTRAIQVSFWCIQEQPSQRPMMGKVVQMLEGIMAIEKPPAPKAAPEGSISGTSLNMSGSISALSTFATSAPGPSSSSSFQTPLAQSSMSVERHTSSLISRETTS
ncbi:G-type lectin S-receptor-like serine/threonine-protein kinase At1g34300 [Chenopodium quinoa]|uniref:G-type lectin S-receptor-like serine/threonine-protein kinase At1g34300 n=1 Tax=Chenopodium quinoa TaxID=63459 RepID=UPI000B789ED0|nr:G-type lectin S-receptor-like serine/threonine-protein kinase At1g34300 [Chenopodium quinoa]